uniref:DNA polymerase delta subunit 3 n=1 Tax=Parastrongyloides trichosuri TaxID=131310 RepID=A0A0N4ZSZ4_PARTI
MLDQLKTWVLDDGVCVTASFISISGGLSIKDATKLLQTFYNENKDKLDATYVIYKRLLLTKDKEGEVFQYQTFLVNEKDITEYCGVGLLEECLGKTLHAVQQKGVPFDLKSLDRDYIGLQVDFNKEKENKNEHMDSFSDDSIDVLLEKDQMKETVNTQEFEVVEDNNIKNMVIDEVMESSDVSNEKGKKRKFDDKLDEGELIKESLKKPNKRIKVSDKEGKKSSSTKVKKNNGTLKESQVINKVFVKELVTENYVDEDGFLVTKSTAKPVEIKEKKIDVPKGTTTKAKQPIEKSSSHQKQTLLSNYFIKKN